MNIAEGKLKQILTKAGIISGKAWDDVVRNAKRLDESIETILKEKDIISGELFYQIIAAGFDSNYLNLNGRFIETKILDLLDSETVNTYKIIPFEFEKKKKLLSIAFTDIWDEKILTNLKKKTGYKIKPFLTDNKSFKFVSNYYRKEVIEKIRKTIEKKSLDAKNARRLLGLIIQYVYYIQPSDIHLEEYSKEGLVKLRVDGFLKDQFVVSRQVIQEMMKIIKSLAKTETNAINQDNDGRFSCRIFNEILAFRISILKTYYGEKICLRVLDESKQRMSLRDLGFNDNHIELIKKEFEKPYGLILVNGPTGAGKSTTLYAMLKFLNIEGVSIATIEDPIEYPLKHINQSQVDDKTGFTFARGLEKLMRQDPDIIVIGEIRDSETVETTIQAALTGHIILSTIHSNTATGTITRLKDMGAKKYLVAGTLNLAISQNLVKKTCPYCRESYTPSQNYLKNIDKDTHILQSLEKLKHFGYLTYTKPSEIQFFKGKGCAKCGDKGYIGRIGVFEILKIDDKIKKMILENKTEEEIRWYAESNGMLTMFEDGLLKATTGLVTLEEIINLE